jgi:hypothetical protein
VSPTRLSHVLPVLVAAALIALLAGCGSDSSGETSTSASASVSVSTPAVTSPIPTATTTAATTTTGGTKKKGTTSTTSGGETACTIPEAFGNFRYSGLSCTAAVAVATAWDQNGKDCNTVDNPNVDEGYHRTCSVEGFTCTTKRDVHSDARFVSCQGSGQGIRFTWLPA